MAFDAAHDKPRSHLPVPCHSHTHLRWRGNWALRDKHFAPFNKCRVFSEHGFCACFGLWKTQNHQVTVRLSLASKWGTAGILEARKPPTPIDWCYPQNGYLPNLHLPHFEKSEILFRAKRFEAQNLRDEIDSTRTDDLYHTSEEMKDRGDRWKSLHAWLEILEMKWKKLAPVVVANPPRSHR